MQPFKHTKLRDMYVCPSYIFFVRSRSTSSSQCQYVWANKIVAFPPKTGCHTYYHCDDDVDRDLTKNIYDGHTYISLNVYIIIRCNSVSIW